MIDKIILMIAHTKIGWIFIGVLGAIAAAFALYYISFAIYLIVGSIYTGCRLIPRTYRMWREELAAAYHPGWGNVELGLTMPDGGEPVEKEEKEAKKEEEKKEEKEA